MRSGVDSGESESLLPVCICGGGVGGAPCAHFCGAVTRTGLWSGLTKPTLCSLEPLPDPRGGDAPEIIGPPPPPPAVAPRPPPRPNNHNAHRAPPQPPRQPEPQQAIKDEEDYFRDDDLDLDLADFEMADQLAREASAAAARGLNANDRMDHDNDEEDEEALLEMRRLEEAAAESKPGPTLSPPKRPPQNPSGKSSSNSTSTNTGGRFGISGGGRSTTMAVKSSGGVSGGVEVLDLDDDDDDELEVEVGSGKRRENTEDIKPLRKKVKSEPVPAERRTEEDEPPLRGGRKTRTVIEIDDSD